MMGRIVDGTGGNFGLKNRRHRLSLAGQSALYPTELWSIERRHLNHNCLYTAFVVHEFSAQSGKEPQNRVFGSAIGGLQWNAAIREGRTNVHNRPPISRQHALQSRERAMDYAQISDLGDALEF